MASEQGLPGAGLPQASLPSGNCALADTARGIRLPGLEAPAGQGRGAAKRLPGISPQHETPGFGAQGLKHATSMPVLLETLGSLLYLDNVYALFRSLGSFCLRCLLCNPKSE